MCGTYQIPVFLLYTPRQRPGGTGILPVAGWTGFAELNGGFLSCVDLSTGSDRSRLCSSTRARIPVIPLFFCVTFRSHRWPSGPAARHCRRFRSTALRLEHHRTFPGRDLSNRRWVQAFRPAPASENKAIENQADLATVPKASWPPVSRSIRPPRQTAPPEP